ncbi:MAG: hypothetical protein MJ096_04845, partial [Clostridia bacterium]|nr:hypothetical protein [Clostridia bacterium]
MKLDFRIDWGYQYLYSRRLYHPQFVWDGTLSVDGGEILNTYKLDYPVIWFGPGHCAVETELPEAKWESRTKRGLSGVRFVAEVSEDAKFYLHTASADAEFSARDIIEKGRIEFPVGPKYLGCSIIVTKTDYLWFRRPLKDGETELDADALGLPVHYFARMRLAWLDAGKSVDFKVDVPERTHDYEETLIHLTAMAAPAYKGGKEEQVAGYVPMELYCDGKLALRFARYFRQHDIYMQILEDEWQRVELPSGTHTLTLKNCHDEYSLAFERITTKNCTRDDGEVSVPEWMLLSETLTGKVFSTGDHGITVNCGGKELTVSCKKGWNEFKLSFDKAGTQTVSTEKDSKTVEVYDIPEEENPVKVGYDMTVVPHDDNGFMDWLLDYTERTRLGNYVLFRSFMDDIPVTEESLTRWGEFCRTHNIWAAGCQHDLNPTLAKAAAERFHDCGQHEYSGAVYAYDPQEGDISADMKEATEKYQAYLKEEIDRTHEEYKTVAFGDASGGIRHAFISGADFVRAETMVGNTQALLSQARPAAESLGKGNWGVHIAIQHNFQPYHENHLGQYFLSLFQPWMMGAEVIYEEDSLFCLFKEERQAWDDLCTGGKRDMTRAFYRFVKTHPRHGKNTRRIAYLEGRYAAPFNGFICDVEQDPHYSVWGKYGNPAKEWSHGQPEKSRAVLDVLMPGACAHPFLQKHDKRRFFFAGTPYGDFDCVPVEAEQGYINNYALLLNLGWNTITDADYGKLKDYVRNGGVLLTGLPQFSTHVGREFLADMDDLALMNGGDLSELCGIKVKGKGGVWCGQWNSAGRADMKVPELSAMPSDSAEEDDAGYLAEVELTDAEIVAWDTFTAKPLLVRRRYAD